MMNFDIHICIQLLVHSKPTKANKITKRRIVKKMCTNLILSYANHNTWQNCPSLHIKVNVTTKEFENRTKFQKHFHSMYKSYTQRIIPTKC